MKMKNGGWYWIRYRGQPWMQVPYMWSDFNNSFVSTGMYPLDAPQEFKYIPMPGENKGNVVLLPRSDGGYEVKKPLKK